MHCSTASHGIKFTWRSGMLFIALPSGRKLTYVKPRIVENKFGGESVTYEGIGATKKWERLESYGPKFVENVSAVMSMMNLLLNVPKRYHWKCSARRWHERLNGCRTSCSVPMATSQNFIKKTNENGSTDHSDRHCHYALFIQFCYHSFKDFINLTGALSALEGAITKMIIS